MNPPYRWMIRPVRGELLRRVGWRLCTAAPGKTIAAKGRRYRLGSWLLAVTDDRRWTLKHQTSLQKRLRSRLGRREREYVLVENDERPRGGVSPSGKERP